MDARNLDELLGCLSDGLTAKYVYFWGHTQRGSRIDQSCFSQWFPAEFEVGGGTFTTAEHFMMFEKARLFDDAEAAKNILKAESPGAAKALGRRVKGFDDTKWIENRWNIAVTGNLAKFTQNGPLQAYLLDTGERVLVEASPVDRIWGIGLDKQSALHKHPSDWKGTNILGFALMEVRDRIRCNAI